MSPLDSKRKKSLLLFTVGLLGTGAAYLLAVHLVTYFIASRPAGPRTPWIAAMPILVLSVVMVVVMRSLRRMDELERKIHTEAMAFAFLGSLFVVIGAGFLSLVGLATLSFSWLAPSMVVFWNLGLVLAVRRYR